MLFKAFFLSSMWELFSFTITEQKGIVFVVMLFFATVVFRFWPWERVGDVTLHPVQSDTLSTYEPVIKRVKYNKKRSWDLSRFDINYARASDLRHMGFSSSFISRWFQLKQEVGFVKSAQQLRDLQLLSESDFVIVEPFLDFSRYEAKPKREYDKHTKVVTVDVNQADSFEFKALRGIGKTLSKRIVKYRNALGGFYNIGQLSEVYGVSDSLLQLLNPQLTLTGNWSKLPINHASKSELKKHPYINYKEANAIINFRELHGFYKSIGDLEKIKLLDSTWLERIYPYLSFD